MCPAFGHSCRHSGPFQQPPGETRWSGHLWLGGHFLAGTCLGTTHSRAPGAKGSWGSQGPQPKTKASRRGARTDPFTHTPTPFPGLLCLFWGGPGLTACPRSLRRDADPDGGQSWFSLDGPQDPLWAETLEEGHLKGGLSLPTSARKSAPGPQPPPVSWLPHSQPGSHLLGAGGWWGALGDLGSAPPLRRPVGAPSSAQVVSAPQSASLPRLQGLLQNPTPPAPPQPRGVWHKARAEGPSGAVRTWGGGWKREERVKPKFPLSPEVRVGAGNTPAAPRIYDPPTPS